MALIIDGYNLIHAAGIIGRGVGPGSLERSRLAVLNFVVESLDPAELTGTTVVFDAQNAPRGLPSALRHRGIAVRFAVGYENADELIEELIEAESAPRRLTVVSSDHRLHRAARRRKAQAIDSDQWYAQTITARRARQQSASATEPVKPMPPFAVSEVEYWLSLFAPTATVREAPPAAVEKSAEPSDAADEREAPNAPDDDPIFPPDYLDAIERELDE